jgi:uncharacterized protein YcbX
MYISAVHVYPIKSGAGQSVRSWDLDPRGLAHDREYMVVDADGQFLTQREVPLLALVTGDLGEPFTVHTPLGSVQVRDAGDVAISLWEHTGPAIDCGDEAADVLGEFLGRPCRLVRMRADQDRPTQRGQGQVGFADGYPLLLIGEASLADLNTRLPDPLPMNRFRPNIVVSDAAAYEEDDLLRVRLGEVAADVVKPCARCAITRVDQATGIRGDGEPLRTLGTFRKAKGGVMFGQNLVHQSLGRLAVGDPVTVEARRG